MSTYKRAIAEELLRRKKAIHSFRAFVLFMVENYIVNDLFEMICEQIDGLGDRLLLEAPPRSGKTFLISQLFPAYYLGLNQKAKIIASSFGDELLRENARSVKRIMSSEKYQALFGNPFENVGDTSVHKQDTILHFEAFKGRYDAFSVGGAIIGKGANLLIVDDPIKNSEMARSKKQKDSLENWFYNDACSRLEGKFSIVLMHQRWAVDDLAGRVLEKESLFWNRKTFKALNAKDESNSPKLLPVNELLHKKKTMSNFEAMYQQNPKLLGGNILKSEWFLRYEGLPLRRKKTFVVADTAMKTGVSNDYTAISVWIISELGDYYLIDMIRKKLESPELFALMVDVFDQYKPSALYIEDKASGTGLIQMLRRKRIPVIELKALKDKYLRVQDVLPKIVSGMVFVPERASWVHEFLMECENFTADGNHAHDDMVDCLSYALGDQILGTNKGLNIDESVLADLNF